MKSAKLFFIFSCLCVFLLSCTVLDNEDTKPEAVIPVTDSAFSDYNTTPSPDTVSSNETKTESTESSDNLPRESAAEFDITTDSETSTAETELQESDLPEKENPSLSAGINTNIAVPEAYDILNEICRIVSESSEAAVYFTDVNEEFYIGIHEEKQYHSASTVKAAYCQYLLRSDIDLNTEILFENPAESSSSGKLTANDTGKTFTVSELMEYSIRYSDNQAYLLLYNTFGIDGFNNYSDSFGEGGLKLSKESQWTRTDPKKLSRVMLDIYKFGEENSILTDHLKNTQYNRQIAAGTSYEAAHKYGSNGGTYGYHDTAIVYAPERAYVLTVMSCIDYYNTDDPNFLFRKLGELCDMLHEILFCN